VGDSAVAETALARLGRLAERDHQTAAALRDQRDALREQPSEGDPAQTAARLHRLLEIGLALGELDQADGHAEKVMARAPDDALAFAVRRHALAARGDEAQLALLYQQRAAAVRDPGARASLLTAAAQLAEKLGELEGAAALLDQAVATAPAHAEALVARAEL